MNHIELRKKIVELSGRYDLVEDTTDYKDAGVTFFLNAGQRYLDRMLNVDSSLIEIMEHLPADEPFLELGRFRSIKGIYYIQDSAVVYLGKLPYDQLSSIRQSAKSDYPTHYALGPTNLELIPPANVLVIHFYPVTHRSIPVYIQGYAYSKEFKSDTDKTWWSTTHPETLIAATMLKMEQFYRNTEGARDWQEVVLQDVQGIDSDKVEEEITGNDQMRTSWQ